METPPRTSPPSTAASRITWLAAPVLGLLSLAACGAERPAGGSGPVAELRDSARALTAAAPADTGPLLDAPDSLPPLPEEVLETAEGEATFYADLFQGRPTASGEPFDQNDMMAAHLSYPFGTRLRVTEPRSGRQVEVRVVDRGPHAPGRRMPAIIDLSKSAARRLGILRQGRAVVTVEVLEWGGERSG